MVAAIVALHGALPSWFALRMMVEDWWKGFRQIFPTRSDMAVAIAAVKHPVTAAWLFAQMRGVPFGLGTAVNQFGRMAALQTAIARRILYFVLGHYADDTAAVDGERSASGAQDHVQRLAVVLGIKLSDTKRKPAAAMRDFLGHEHDLSRIRSDGYLGYGPKLGMREKFVEEIHDIRQTQYLPSGRASKVRGTATWIDTGLEGRVCRGALTALIARQYYEDSEDVPPGSNIDHCLAFLAAAAAHQSVRAIPLKIRARRPVLVYTDASAEKGKVRIGAMVIAPGARTEIVVYDPPQKVVDAWGTGDTIINQAELHAAPIVACTMPHLLRQADVIWFIDNSAAEAALVKAGSPTQTMCTLALVATAALASLKVRPWFEHIPSEDNPADVLSRGGLEDAAVAEAVRSGEFLVREPVEPPTEAVLNYEFWWQQASDVDE